MVEESDQFESLVRGHIAQIGTWPEQLESLLDESPKPVRGITIKFTESTLEDLQFLSDFLKVSKGSLIRMLVADRLKESREAIEKAHAERMGPSDE